MPDFKLSGTRKGSVGQQTDNQGRVRVGPESHRNVLDAVWPYRHGEWWNWDAERGRTDTVDDLMEKMRLQDHELAKEHLEFAQSVAQSALGRAEAADRRATTIAGTVAISASLTLGGASLLLDATKWSGEATARLLFAVGLLATTLGFVMAAIYALRALVSKQARTWNWLTPADMWESLRETEVERRLGRHAARTLDSFAANWEITDFKNRNIDNALRSLIFALLSVTFLTVVAMVAVL